jgi:hypothetical protein
MTARLAVMPLERSGGQAQFVVQPPGCSGNNPMGPLVIWIEKNLKKTSRFRPSRCRRR